MLFCKVKLCKVRYKSDVVNVVIVRHKKGELMND